MTMNKIESLKEAIRTWWTAIICLRGHNEPELPIHLADHESACRLRDLMMEMSHRCVLLPFVDVEED
jgi:hypothetical protein